MQIIWLGYSCFLLKTSTGKRILMDAYNDLLINNEIPHCDIVTLSHFSHCNDLKSYDQNITEQFINKSGLFDFGSIRIEGLNTFHDSYNGLKRGPNIIYLIYSDNLCLCHLGGLGCIPDDNIMNKLSNIDILFVPIGGHFTLLTSQAIKLCEIISPKLIIPMNYSTHNTKILLNESKNFITNMKNIKKIESNSIYSSDIEFDSNTTMILKSPI